MLPGVRANRVQPPDTNATINSNGSQEDPKGRRGSRVLWEDGDLHLPDRKNPLSPTETGDP